MQKFQFFKIWPEHMCSYIKHVATNVLLRHLSDQGTFTPVGAQGGPEKTTFPPEFWNEICTIYVRAIKNHNSEKKIKMLFRFKMAAK